MTMPIGKKTAASWLIAAILCSVGAIIYSNTLHVPFYFDDRQSIVENDALHITEFSYAQIAGVAKNAYLRNRPVAYVSFALNYLVHQDQLPGYHLVNIGIHLCAALCLYFLLVATFSLPAAKIKGDPRLIAFLAAALWLAHPIQTQAVTYVVQRMTSLVGMLYLLSLCCYVQGRLRQMEKRWSLGWFGVSVLAGLLALGTKENAVTLPFFIFLYEFYFFRDLDWGWFKKSLPWCGAVVAMLVLLGVIFTNGHPLKVIQDGFHYRDFNAYERLLTESRVIFLYISLLLYPNPNRLNLDYNFPLSHGLVDPVSTLAAIAGLLALVVVAVAVARKERFISFVILWFLGTLFLESSIIGLDLVYEHRLYLPSAFAVALLPVLAFRLGRLRPVVIAVIGVVIALSGYWTYQRNQTWSDPVAFHQDMVIKAPGKFRAHYNLGIALMSVGRYADSIPEFIKTLQLEPRMLMVHSQLASAYKKINRIDLAFYHYNQVLALSPDDPKTLSAVGELYGKQGDLDKAKAYFAHALRVVPDDAGILLNMGTALHRQGDTATALAYYQKSLQVDPAQAMAYNNIALIYLGWGQFQQAENYIHKALAINPNHQNAQQTLARINQLRSNPL